MTTPSKNWPAKTIVDRTIYIRKKLYLLVLTLTFWAPGPYSFSASVVINEIHYHPPNQDNLDGGELEFIELYNAGSQAVDLSGWRLCDGIQYTFPAATRIEASSYAVVAKSPMQSYWIEKQIQPLGPYDGYLSNDGETVSLVRPDGTVEDSLSYRDRFPWPVAADGDGPSMERLTPSLPASDYHSWRSSYYPTPGRTNTVAGMEPKPILLSYEATPLHPTSKDPVHLKVALDSPDWIQEVVLQWENATFTNGRQVILTSLPPNEYIHEVVCTKTATAPDYAVYEATVPSATSQSLIQMNLRVRLPNGNEAILPHEYEREPVMNYFVYDHEIQSMFPILWLFVSDNSLILPSQRNVSAVAIQSPDSTHPYLYKGAYEESSNPGRKIRLTDQERYKGNQTINLITIFSQNSVSDLTTMYREKMSNQVFQLMQIPMPQMEWCRLIEILRVKNTDKQDIGILFPQLNEDFLEQVGLNKNGELYKNDHGWENHGNRRQGLPSLNWLLESLQEKDLEKRQYFIEAHLNVREIIDCVVTSMFLSNWDGFCDNQWLYRDPDPASGWLLMPWDLDQTWGYPSSAPIYELELTYPLDGQSKYGNIKRFPSDVISPIMAIPEFYQEYWRRLREELTNRFSEERILSLLHAEEQVLLDDLRLIEEQTQDAYSEIQERNMRERIERSFRLMREYTHHRMAYLKEQLDVPVSEWEIY